MYNGGVSDLFRGDIKQARIYKRVLDATEISANFAATCSYDPVNQSSLVFWAPLREATTSVSVADISSTSSTGTHSGTGNSMSRTGLSSSTCGATPAELCVERENGYRYSINTQEKVDEISGEGNHTTAEFWEYDSRLGRRWNVDPKPNPSISVYACFANNPILKTDINGDSVGVDQSFSSDPNLMKGLEELMKTKEGRSYVGQYAAKGQTVAGYTFQKDGKYHKQGVDLNFKGSDLTNNGDDEGGNTQIDISDGRLKINVTLNNNAVDRLFTLMFNEGKKFDAKAITTSEYKNKIHFDIAKDLTHELLIHSEFFVHQFRAIHDYSKIQKDYTAEVNILKVFGGAHHRAIGDFTKRINDRENIKPLFHFTGFEVLLNVNKSLKIGYSKGAIISHMFNYGAD